MLPVVGGHGAEAVRRQELSLVEELGEQSFQPVDADDAEQQSARSGRTPEEPQIDELLPVVEALPLEETREALADENRPVEHRLVDDGCGQHGNDAHHGADLDRDRHPVRRHEPVVEQPVGVVPQPLVGDRAPDRREMLEELEHETGGGTAAAGQEDRHAPHREGVGRHPTGRVGLLERATDRQVGAIQRPDVVQTEETALEQVRPGRVLEVHPPGEVHQELVEDLTEEVEVAGAVDDEHLEGGPRLDGRVDVAEIPFVGGQRPVRMLEPLPAEQEQLILGERGVDMGQRDAVEGQIPRREPGVLPLVRHRHDVEGLETTPAGVAAVVPRVRRPGLGGIAVQPSRDVVVVELLAPQHAGEGLPHHQRLVGRGGRRRQLGIERVGLAAAPGNHRVERRSQSGGGSAAGARRAQPQPQLDRRARRDGQAMPERDLRPAPVRIHRGRAGHDVVVDAVLGEPGSRGPAVQTLDIRLVLAEERVRPGAVRARGGQQFELTEERVVHRDRVSPDRLHLGPRTADVPGPGVAEPGGGQHVEGLGVRTGVGHLHRHEHVQRIGLHVVHVDDPVAVAVEGPGVEQLVLGIELAPAAVLVAELLVREGHLGVVVAPPVPGVAGHAVEVPPVLLDVLPVVSLSTRQPEQAFLEDRVAPVPQRQPQAQPLLDVAESGEPVLPPPKGPGPGVLVREVGPRLAVGAVVLADSAPLTLADVGAPEIPVVRLAQPVLELPERADPFPLSPHRRPPSDHPALPTPATLWTDREAVCHPQWVSRHRPR